MKRAMIAAALTWDGTRVPVRALPPKARAFLSTGKATLLSVKKMEKLFAADEVNEVRICWVPQLRGGIPLTEPFATSEGKRIPFHAAQTKPFGDILGVVYRRSL
jgi:hypothetical protein